ncbi:MAG: TIGR02147 family protein [Myxococcota bacterium]
MPLPKLFDYMDYRAFLVDWFAAKKREDPTYSYSRFAEESGGSKSTFANVLRGARHPRPQSLDQFAHAIGMSPEERNYLGVLVELSSAQTEARRQQTLERILSNERYGQVRMAETEGDENIDRYLEFWYLPAIRELASIGGFQADADWVVGRLTPKITREQAQEALDTLFDLGLLRTDEAGNVRAREPEIRTQNDAYQTAVARFYRTAIPTLLQRMDTDRSDTQHLRTSTLSLPASAIPEAKLKIDALMDQLGAMQHPSSPNGTMQVYQVAVQLLPLSEGD